MAEEGETQVPLQTSRTGAMTDAAPDDGVPRDHGWAWVCLASTFTAYFVIMGGLMRSFGVFYTEIEEQYQASAKAITWIPSLYLAMTMGVGPAVPILVAKLGLRPTIVLGGLLMGVGVLMSAFATRVEHFYLTYSIIAGFGSSISFNPSIVTLSQYFEKRRSFALGLASSGASSGTFILSPVLRAIINHYSLYGSFFVLAGLALHLCITGAVMRPLEQYRKIRKKTNDQNSPSASELDDAKVHNFELTLEENTSAHDTRRKRNKLCIALHNNLACGEKTPKPHKKRTIPLTLTLLKNYVFLAYMMMLFLSSFGFSSIFTMINAHAVHLGYTKTQAALLISVNGAADLLMRPLIGLFADLKIARKSALYATALIVAGLSSFLFSISRNYILMVIVSSLFGLSLGCIIPLLTPVLIDSFGIENIQTTFSLAVFVVGVAQVTGGPTVGFLKDQTGDWYASFYLVGSVNVLSGCILFLELFLNPVKKNINKKADKSDIQDTL